jgi:hypothetical protein
MPSLTYAELAEALRITPASANKLARRRRWPRVPGNDGKARVSVPEDALVPRDDPPVSPPPSPLDVPPVSPPDNPVHAEIARLECELAGVRGELSGVREALDEARARAGAAEARSAELSADLAAARGRRRRRSQPLRLWLTDSTSWRLTEPSRGGGGWRAEGEPYAPIVVA